ncbi:amidase [Variovorax humicola]|uniref:Amidase n=1 Tax=Variovorax humicola TaxID=1769758 RepID=A0ABU8VVI2_9BURK
MNPLWTHSALELAGMVSRREVSCAEVVEAHLTRIAAVNPRVNAVVRVLADEARAAAEAADRKVAAGAALGPLHGVPITVKENIDMAGLPTTWGVPGLADAVVPLDAPVVERMRAAGAIPIGRTNLPDMALRVHTDSCLHGATLNPWNAARTAGGSSGGDAVALATGMCAIGLGNDIGGSLRNPANACGIASIRPSAGRVPDAGLVPGEDRLLAVQLMQVQGPMARRVADVRAALQVMMGAHPRDPWSITAPLAGSAAPGPLRVAVVAEPPGGGTDPRVAAAVRRAADALSDAGYAVVETCPPRYEDAIAVWTQFLLGDFAAVMPQLMPLIGGSGATFLAMMQSAVPPLPDAAAMSIMLMQRDGVARAWSQFLAEYPLVLSPTWSQLPFEAGFDAASEAGAKATMEMVRPVLPANLMGLPSACVPADRDEATGLPIGVLLTGARFRDDQCLDAAEAIEQRCALATPIDPVR